MSSETPQRRWKKFYTRNTLVVDLIRNVGALSKLFSLVFVFFLAVNHFRHLHFLSETDKHTAEMLTLDLSDLRRPCQP